MDDNESIIRIGQIVGAESALKSSKNDEGVSYSSSQPDTLEKTEKENTGDKQRHEKTVSANKGETKKKV